MRIWYQGVESLNELYREFQQREFKLASRPGTEVFFKFLTRGILTDAELYAFSYGRFLNDRQVMDGILQAEKEGFDAVVLDCWFDPCLPEAREILNIPITGPAESSMLVSCLLGARFAVVSSCAGYVPKFNLMIASYGMGDRAIPNPVRSMRTSDVYEGLTNPQPIIDEFKSIAKTCIEDGAEVIIPGCTVLASILTANDIKEVDGVPILDCVVAAIMLAQLLVDLKRAGLSWISRKGLYRQPSQKQIEMLGKFI